MEEIKEMTGRKAPKDRTPEEQQIVNDRHELFDYVHKTMGYTKGMKIGGWMAHRLEGMHDGVFVSKINKAKRADYPYKIIFYTFKLMKSQIEESLKTVSFKSEKHKFNYIMVIIENNINDVYLAVEKNKRANETLDKTVVDIKADPVVKFKKAEEPKSAKLFTDEIW